MRNCLDETQASPKVRILIGLGTWALTLGRCSVNTREVSLHNPEALAFQLQPDSSTRPGSDQARLSGNSCPAWGLGLGGGKGVAVVMGVGIS